MKKGFKSLGLLLSLFLGFSFINVRSAWAGGNFELSPIQVEFSPSGSLANQSFILKSTGDKPVAIQMGMTTREIDLDGNEVNRDADEQFTIYPPQLVIPPGEQRAVRVTWLGDPNPTKELAFRIIAEQIPIDLTEVVQTQQGKSVTVKVSVRYLGAVYITPAGSSSKVVIESASTQKDKDGKDQLVLNFVNQGTAHKLLEDLKITVTSNQGKTVTLTTNQLKGVAGENLLAESKRRFVLPWPKELPVGPVTATFETSP